MKRKVRTYSGTTSQEVTAREAENRKISRSAAAQSMVLLHNDGVLPLPAEKPVALFGCGALHMIKGGTGSGDVNTRDPESLAQGLRSAGYTLDNEAWLADYEVAYQAARMDWRQRVLDKAAISGDAWGLVEGYTTTPRNEPIGRYLTAEEESSRRADTAVFVLCRTAGEGADRHVAPGDYYLKEEEQEFLSYLKKNYEKLVVVLNCGGQIDLNFIDSLSVNALLAVSQPGLEGGGALADVLSGAVTPSGRMADTWAYHYEDFPGAAEYSHCNGDVTKEIYREGIYMGYRYFDTFGVEPRIPFGFGLSYTTFETTFAAMTVNGMEITVEVSVTNTGKTHGREVVQLYVACPQGMLPKERRRLAAFGKTPLLQPGESCTLQITFSAELLTSFDERLQAYVLERGDYVLCLGGNVRDNVPVAVLHLTQDCKTAVVKAICPLQQPLEELQAPAVEPMETAGLPVAELDPAAVVTRVVAYDETYLAHASDAVKDMVATMSREQLISLTSGDPGKGHDSDETFGASGLSTPGVAGETHNCAEAEPWNLASVGMADGPAGLRLSAEYSVRPDGSIVKATIVDSIEGGFFSDKKPAPDHTVYHQYCTAFPVGTALAQSWDTELVQQVGAAVAREMEEFGVALWLAPGMNLHRNPLCGRNFEYYSEDPLMAGLMAAAMTRGVQNSGCGVGTTVKHFACNGVEENRRDNNSILSQRALRELYLRGFEIVVRSAQPMALMSSYNLVNGVHSANSFDLITSVLRNEWGFDGLVMTDWTTTGIGGSCPAACMASGHNLIMPGDFEDLKIIREALDGTNGKQLTVEQVQQSVAGLAQIVLQTLDYEQAKPYGKQYADLPAFVSSKVK